MCLESSPLINRSVCIDTRVVDYSMNHNLGRGRWNPPLPRLCGLRTRYTLSVMDSIFSRIRGGAVSITSSLPSNVTSHPRYSYSRTSSSCGTLCGGPTHPACGSYDTPTTSMRPPGARRL